MKNQIFQELNDISESRMMEIARLKLELNEAVDDGR